MEETITLKKHTLSVNSTFKKLLKLPKEKTYVIGEYNIDGHNIDYIHNAVVSIHNYPETDQVIQDYLECFPDKVNEKTKVGGFTPLMILCRHFDGSSFTVLNILIERGADLNAIDDYGKSVFNHCLDGLKSVIHGSNIWSKYLSLVKILLERGSDPDHVYKGKSVFLHYLKLCYYGYEPHEENIDLFISKSLNPGIVFKKSIRFVDTISNNRKLVEYLEEKIDDTSTEEPKFTSEQIDDLVHKIMKLIE